MSGLNTDNGCQWYSVGRFLDFGRTVKKKSSFWMLNYGDTIAVSNYKTKETEL